MLSSGIYKIQHVASGRCYVGSAVNIDKRVARHLSMLKKNKHPNKKLQRAWEKYGGQSIVTLVIEYVADKTELIKREQHWIDELRCVSDGYNIAPVAGSSLGRTTSLETKAKLSAAFKGRKPHPNTLAAITGRIHSAETRERIAAAHRGKNKPKHTQEWKDARSASLKNEWATGVRKVTSEQLERIGNLNRGKAVSNETRARMSESGKCRAPMSDETRRKISIAGNGRVFTDERRKKISAALVGRKCAHLTTEQRAHLSAIWKGRKWTPEQIAKRVATRALNKLSKIN